MFERHLTKHLREGEALQATIRRSPLVDVGRWMLVAAFVLGAFFFLVPFIQTGAWGVLGFIVLITLGVGLGVRTVFVWSLNAFLLTDQRLVDVDQRGFFTTSVSSAAYDRIQDVSYSVRGVLPTMLRIGSVEVQTAGAEVRLELSGVRDPQAVVERLTALINQRRHSGERDAASRIVAALERAEIPSGRPH